MQKNLETNKDGKLAISEANQDEEQGSDSDNSELETTQKKKLNLKFVNKQQ